MNRKGGSADEVLLGREGRRFAGHDRSGVREARRTLHVPVAESNAPAAESRDAPSTTRLRLKTRALSLAVGGVVYEAAVYSARFP